MAIPRKFHLVDSSGNPLEERFHAAVKQLEGTLFHGFEELGDPAVISNTIEETATRIAQHEKKYGPVRDLVSYFLRVFTNLARTKVKRGYYTQHETTLSEVQLQQHTDQGVESIEAHVQLRETLDALESRKRKIAILHATGWGTREIAQLMETSEENIHTILHRIREQIKKLL